MRCLDIKRRLVDTSLYIRFAVFFSDLALIFHIIGTATNAWITIDSLSFKSGLWSHTEPLYNVEKEGDIYRAPRGLAVCGVVLGIPATIFISIAVLTFNQIVLKRVSVMASFSAGTLILLSGQAMVSSFDKWYPTSEIKTGYSLGLSVTGGVFYIVSGVLTLVDMTLPTASEDDKLQTTPSTSVIIHQTRYINHAEQGASSTSVVEPTRYINHEEVETSSTTETSYSTIM
ncbi:hypothetical protein SNE40_009023 [Patella caerulea]|uniref:Uncharacterized protein n=1 Tax=Patella caerulea TaxID=87958 RepID=A0AAN8PX93_PATCE